MKICSKCHVEKEATKGNFYTESLVKDGLRADCKECNSKKCKKHHASIGSEYAAWKNMLYRCNNKESNAYHNYGERGIKVCKRWNDSYENFIEDVGYMPTKKHTIDRIDNDGNYEPNNVKWSTRREQLMNRRVLKNNKSGKTGVFWERRGGHWVVNIGAEGKNYYLGSYKKFDEAVEVRKNAELKHFGKHVD